MTLPLYQEIAEAIRRELVMGHLGPGDRLPSVRAMAARWNCTAGTVQRAYQELAREGLVASRSGQGTHVLAGPEPAVGISLALRRATLIHQVERFLLEVLAAGHSAQEVDQAVRLALDRWRTLSDEPEPHVDLRFAGSHDPAVSLIAGRFATISPGYQLRVNYVGSLGGLMALARGEADLAGCHLWDQETDTYNEPFVRKLLPGVKVALVTVAHRRLGLLVSPGNPAHIAGLADLMDDGLRFVNRQAGAGTRVWLDAQLRSHGIDPRRIQGYDREVSTHSAAAHEILEERADVALGVETAAIGYGLAFVPLTRERYDLVIPCEQWDTGPMQALTDWLCSPVAKQAIGGLGGYELEQTGSVHWVL